MKTDSYTKSILTVIAIALIALVFQNFNVVPAVTAKASPSTSTSNSGTIDVNIVSVNGRSFFGTSLQVEVVNTPEVEVVNTPKVEIKTPFGIGGLDVNVTNPEDFK